MSVTIRPGSDADAPRVAALMGAVFAEYPDSPFVLAEFPEIARVASHYRQQGGEFWVAERQGRFVGCFAVDEPAPGVFEIHKVYLDKNERGLGLAQRLHDVAMAFVAARGGRRVRLWSDSRFVSGHRFYEKLGYRRIEGVLRYCPDSTHAWEYGFDRLL